MYAYEQSFDRLNVAALNGQDSWAAANFSVMREVGNGNFSKYIYATGVATATRAITGLDDNIAFLKFALYPIDFTNNLTVTLEAFGAAATATFATDQVSINGATFSLPAEYYNRWNDFYLKFDCRDNKNGAAYTANFSAYMGVLNTTTAVSIVTGSTATTGTLSLAAAGAANNAIDDIQVGLHPDNYLTEWSAKLPVRVKLDTFESFNYAIFVAAESDYIITGATALNDLAGYTEYDYIFKIKLKLSDYNSTDYFGIMDTTSGTEVSFIHWNDKSMTFAFKTGASFKATYAAYSPYLNTGWNTWKLHREPGNHYIELNGVIVGTSTDATALADNSQIQLGRYGSGSYLDGYIASFEFWGDGTLLESWNFNGYLTATTSAAHDFTAGGACTITYAMDTEAVTYRYSVLDEEASDGFYNGKILIGGDLSRLLTDFSSPLDAPSFSFTIIDADKTIRTKLLSDPVQNETYFGRAAVTAYLSDKPFFYGRIISWNINGPEITLSAVNRLTEYLNTVNPTITAESVTTNENERLPLIVGSFQTESDTPNQDSGKLPVWLIGYSTSGTVSTATYAVSFNELENVTYWLNLGGYKYNDVTEIPSTDYGEFAASNTYYSTRSQHEVTIVHTGTQVDLQTLGLTIDADSAAIVSGETWDQRVAHSIRYLCDLSLSAFSTQSLYDDGWLDEIALNKINRNNRGKCYLYQRSKASGEQIDRLCNDFGIRSFYRADGKLSFDTKKDIYSMDTAVRLSDAEHFGLEPEFVSPQDNITVLEVGCNMSPARNQNRDYLSVESPNTALYGNMSERYDGECIADGVGAQSLAGKVLGRKSYPVNDLEINLPLNILNAVEIGDIVKISLTEMAISERAYRCAALNVGFDNGIIRATFEDAQREFDNAFILAGTDIGTWATNWANANSTAKKYGYLCDTAGYFEDLKTGKNL